MTIKHILGNIGNLTESERNINLRNLLHKLTPTSANMILDYQNTFDKALDKDSAASYERFRKGQNEVILDCLKIELSSIGTIVRKEIFDMNALTEETEV